PDLVPLVISDDWVEDARLSLPELPEAKRTRYTGELGLTEYDAEVLTASRDLACYFESCTALYNQPKTVANWLMGELSRALNDDGNRSIAECPVSPQLLADLLLLIDKGTISNKIAKTVFDEMYRTSKPPAVIVEEKGLVQVSDTGEIQGIIDEIMAANAGQVEEYRGGKEKVFGFFVGQVMRASKGKANPAVVNDILLKKLKG
ncbi:MAG: Asp-tRNA(Asn)/Glu-tRNA(Gln) amidotransferase GatCAB subunit B, partial [Geobacter sp.]